ncbi:murein L,D-transpeptidase catalytic domain family protein [Flavobacterium sp. MAH-1]|uniref:Murein L,D-transpeptidase catalytic domain family protein n=1 Tax=Flavobacterium agri TaxID=2743471 RepID=A0A7Y8Y4H1_9FLAO|nr:murein L,D-transpeptidase catalytic domain family protein [Flavobacterium agri]NUY81689.1 murein L,D-transpeptidase catalytic domain family protein [Flavobacterium agri]NYA71713.1 murein L,D-transpeptidase catalytic domain family protein [Flavobacterium agri]
MIYRIFPVLLAAAFAFTSATPGKTEEPVKKAIATTTKSAMEMKIENVYGTLNAGKFSLPTKQSFYKALEGFYKLRANGTVSKDILTVIDFTMSSNTKRLWVIDLATNTVLFNSLCAHGRNTGDEFATKFSNRSESNMSSLGFYATGEIYNGKHGQSLKLDGLQPGVNDHARARGVVMHAADYVSESFISAHRRLGRSQGCPALPQELTKEIISTIKGKSLLFIYHPSGEKNFEKLLS